MLLKLQGLLGNLFFGNWNANIMKLRKLYFIFLLVGFLISLSCINHKNVVDAGKTPVKLYSAQVVYELHNAQYHSDIIQVMKVYSLDDDRMIVSSTKRLEVRRNGRLVASTSLPSAEYVKNFCLENIVETKDGFDLYFSFGGGWYYHYLVISICYCDCEFFFTKVVYQEFFLANGETVKDGEYVQHFVPKRNFKDFDLRRVLFGEDGDTFSLSNFENIEKKKGSKKGSE